MNTFLAVLVVSCLVLIATGEVIVLDSKNFEHLTQASTGATTGDWLVKFYAPWCGHCKKMEPTYAQVADALEGEVNVAKVDVTASRELGTRFDIKGFPTLKLISKGKVYTFKGRRSLEEITEFARGGYQIHEPEEVTPPLGFFGEIAYVYRHAYKQAGKDIVAGKYFTMNVILTFMPMAFLIMLLLIFIVPKPTPSDEYIRARKAADARRKKNDDAEVVSEAVNAAPPTAQVDTAYKSDKSD